MAELPLNPEQSQQKFEGILEHGEGAAFLEQSDVDEKFHDALTGLMTGIDQNTYLEPKEKAQLKVAVLKQVVSGLNGVDSQLEVLLRAQAQDTTALREKLYLDSVAMVNDLSVVVGHQINTAADYYHIDDEEFKNEVLGQMPYIHSGIPGLDKLADVGVKKGLAPRDAMQAAAAQYLSEHQNVFDYDLVTHRYPNLKVPEKTFSCAKINGNENLRDIATGKSLRTATSGEILQVVGPFPSQGKYTYELVLDKRGHIYKLCTNDGDHVIPVEYSKGTYQTKGAASPESTVELSTLEEPLKTMVENGYATAEGILTAQVNPLSIEKVIPDSVQTATITLNQSFNGARIPQGQPIPIVRQGNTFVFAGSYAHMGRSDERVRIYQGDELQFASIPPAKKTPTANTDTGAAVDTGATTDTGDTGEIMARNYHEIPYTVSAYWHWMRDDWQAPNVIEREDQEKVVCAAYVQRTLEGIYGHDFAKEVFIQDGHFVDAWQLAGRVDASGYGHTAMDFSRYYTVDSAKQKVSVDTTQPGYNNDVIRFVTLAAQPASRTGVLFMHYKRTHADEKIIAHLEDGGSLNSHAMLVLGPQTRTLEASAPDASLATTILSSMKARLGKSYDESWEKNRYLLGTLKGVTVNGVALNFSDGEFRSPDGNVVGVQKGDKISYQDTQVTDFYHSDGTPGASPARVVGLTETMIQGNFDPVKLSQWDSEVVNNKMPKVGEDFIVGEFRVDAGATDLPAAIREHYEAQATADPIFRANNPIPDTYVKRTMDFLIYVHVINNPAALPVVGARIPIFDWSKKPMPPAKPKVEKSTLASIGEKTGVTALISSLTS